MKKRYLFPVLLIFLPMLAFGLFSIFDTDAVYSDREKRELTPLPELTAASYADASFMKRFEDYYADTFPLRGGLLAAARRVRSLILLTGLVGGEDVVVLPSARTVAVVPEGGGEAGANEAQELSGILYYGNRLMEIFCESDANLTAYASVLNRLAEAGGRPLYVMLPTPAYTLYAPEEQRAAGTDFAASLDKLKGLLDGPVLLDLDTAMRKAAAEDEAIYFRTDHHWTARGAYLAADALARADGLTLPTLGSYASGSRSGFLGSLYNSAAAQSVSSKFDRAPDTVTYYFPQYGYTLDSYASIALDDAEKRSLVVPDFAGDSNLYNIFCGGDMPIAHIRSEVGNGRSIFVIRDSYGHALLPFLSDLYEDVYAVDPRYYTADYTLKIGAFCDAHGIDSILVVNYSPMAVGGYWIEFAPYLENLLP